MIERILCLLFVPITISLLLYKVELYGINIATFLVFFSIFLTLVDTKKLIYRLSYFSGIKHLLILWLFFISYILISIFNSDTKYLLNYLSYLLYALYSIVLIYLNQSLFYIKLRNVLFVVIYLSYFIALLVTFDGTISGRGLLEAQHNTTTGLLFIFLSLSVLSLNKSVLFNKIIVFMTGVFVLLNGARGAITIFFACCLLYSFRRFSVKNILLSTTLATTIFILLLYSMPEYFSLLIFRLESIYDTSISSSTNYRISVISNSLSHIFSNPFGTGVGSFQLYFPKLSHLDLSTVTEFSADNTFIYVGFNVGLIPLALLLFFTVKFLIKNKNYKSYLFSLVLFISITLSMLFDIVTENGNFIFLIVFLLTNLYYHRQKSRYSSAAPSEHRATHLHTHDIN